MKILMNGTIININDLNVDDIINSINYEKIIDVININKIYMTENVLKHKVRILISNAIDELNDCIHNYYEASSFGFQICFYLMTPDKNNAMLDYWDWELKFILESSK